MNKINNINRLAILKSDIFLNHKTGFCCPESSNRLQAVYDNLYDSNKIIYPEINNIEVSEDILLLGHTKEMIQKIKNTKNTKINEFSILDDNTTITCSDSFDVSRLAVGAVIKGIDLLVSKEANSCFLILRPPGHHAERNKSMGFCLFNNIAIGAKYAQKIGLKKVMVIDFDVHHGNGTQDILMNDCTDDNFLFIDIHQSGIYPSTGFVDDIHASNGMTINIPLSHGNDDDYASIIKRIIIPVARQYSPEIILVSCGFDALQDDPMSNMSLSENIYRHITKYLVRLSQEIDCGLLYSLEGGYNPETLSSACNSVILEMIGDIVDTDIIYQNSVNNGINKAIKEIKKYWRVND